MDGLVHYEGAKVLLGCVFGVWYKCIYKMKSCFLFVMTFQASTRHLWLLFCTFLCTNVSCGLTWASLAALPLEWLSFHLYKWLHDIWSWNAQNGKHCAGTLDLISGLPSLQSYIKHCTESNWVFVCNRHSLSSEIGTVVGVFISNSKEVELLVDSLMYALDRVSAITSCFPGR